MSNQELTLEKILEQLRALEGEKAQLPSPLFHILNVEEIGDQKWTNCGQAMEEQEEYWTYLVLQVPQCELCSH